jgi:hypothetical protein
MTNPIRELTTEELEEVGGGFGESEHSQMTALQTASQQLTYMMSAADTVIRDICPL